MHDLFAQRLARVRPLIEALGAAEARYHECRAKLRQNRSLELETKRATIRCVFLTNSDAIELGYVDGTSVGSGDVYCHLKVSLRREGSQTVSVEISILQARELQRLLQALLGPPDGDVVIKESKSAAED